MANERSLRSIELLSSLDSSDISRIEEQCSWRRLRMGERVFDRGSVGTDVFFVLDGAVSVVNFSPGGREIGFASARSGQIFGEMAAIDGQPRSASIVASEDTWIATLPGEKFMELIETHALVTLELLRRLSRKVREVGDRVMELSNLEVASRVYAELLRLVASDESLLGVWIIDPFPPVRELARSASVSREEASRALSDLYPSGVIRRKGEVLYLTDRKALEDIVASVHAEG
jgi:CRP-like cAMP-binding protein